MAADKPLFLVTIPSHLVHVAAARNFLKAICKTHALDEDTIEGVALAVHEAITNVIRHGHRHDHDKTITLTCSFSTEQLEIHILDEGPPFDITAVPDLDPAELRVGGRGVFLMRTLFDELGCQPRPEAGNDLRLVKRCALKLPSPTVG